MDVVEVVCAVFNVFAEWSMVYSNDSIEFKSSEDELIALN